MKKYRFIVFAKYGFTHYLLKLFFNRYMWRNGQIHGVIEHFVCIQTRQLVFQKLVHTFKINFKKIKKIFISRNMTIGMHLMCSNLFSRSKCDSKHIFIACRELHELSEYMITSLKISIYSDDILKIPCDTIFYGEYKES